MNRMLICSTLASLFGLANAALASETVDPNALEPCINGQVSASGLYRTQADEDAARAEAQRLSQAIDRQVSANGR